MSDAQEMVTAFHRAFDIAIGTVPAVPDAATCALRVSLIQEEFAELREYGKEIGFKWVESNPLVRSSYHAAEQVRALSVVHRKLYHWAAT